MSNEIVPYQQLKSLVAKPDTRNLFVEILGQGKGAALITSMLNVVYNDDNLRDCEPNSVITSTLKAAALDLPIEPSLGMAYLIGYKDNKKGKKFARFQPGYKGYQQLALRTGQYKHLNVAEIFEGERVTENRITGEIQITGEKRSDSVIAYVGYLELVTGYSAYVYMTVEEIHEHAKRFSQGYGFRSSAWQTNTAAMEKKTVLLKLIRDHGVLSFQLTETIQQDEGGMVPTVTEEDAGQPAPDDVVEGEYAEAVSYVRPDSPEDWASVYAVFQGCVDQDVLVAHQQKTGDAQTAFDMLMKEYGEILP